METYSPKETWENLGFDDLISILSQNLGVTSESLIQAFDKSQITIRKRTATTVSRKRFFRDEAWTVREEKDDKGYYNTIENGAGGKYRIGMTPYKEWDKTTQTMVEKVTPIVVDDMPTFFYGGRAPDSFEDVPGRHPADA